MPKNKVDTALKATDSTKKDEFYTQLDDIENELKHYKDQFKGKVVFCNCDDPKESKFVKYFSQNFEHLGLKKLIATHFKGANLFTNEPPYKLEYSGDANGNRMPDPNEFTTKMIGDGDFRSEECIELLKEADIVVTNPPFSLFREYVVQLMKYEKKFLIIGNQKSITVKEMIPLLMKNKMWLGLTMNGSNRWFRVPDNYPFNENAKHKVDENGFHYIFVNNPVWFTNLDHGRRHEKITLYKRYKKGEFPKYDNYDAIDISEVDDKGVRRGSVNLIPLDYEGVMGVPITFLHKYNPDQFEIVGVRKGNDGKDLSIDGKCPFYRILIKHKNPEK